MTHITHALKTSLFMTAVAVAGLASVPALSLAATYLYVDNTGEVKTVVADNNQQAMMIAPNIALHSGVMLMDSPADATLVGDEVQVVR